MQRSIRPSVLQVHNDTLGELIQSRDHPIDTTSLPDFLTSLGMPMYLEKLISSDITTLPQLHHTSAAQLQQAGIQNEAHLHRFLTAMEITRSKGSRKAQKGATSTHVVTVSATARVIDRV